LPAPLPSTCSKVTPIAAINSVVSFTLCPNESDPISRNFLAQKETAGGNSPRQRFRRRVRRFVGTEHEAFASAFDRAAAARRRRGGNHRLQRHQESARHYRGGESCHQIIEQS